MGNNIENKTKEVAIADKVSFETSLKYAILTGLVKFRDVITRGGLSYSVKLELSKDEKIGTRLVPYNQAC